MTDIRLGIGYDIHRLDRAATGGVVLAGVPIPCDYEVVAHSDGDVVLHAVGDALLGALAAGDLGQHFPEDERNANRDSAEILAEILDLPALIGWQPVQVDVNIMAEVPRLGVHREAMRNRLAELLGIARDTCSIKARTNEGCDAIGRREAIAAQVIIQVARRTS